jgi:hypothetical protein
MMEDSFSFEPIKLNAGSDPTKAHPPNSLHVRGVLLVPIVILLSAVLYIIPQIR